MSKGRGKGGARAKIREYFLSNIGKKITAKKLQKVAGISEWARRVRELRNEEGYQILSNNDLSELKPGEYILNDPKPVPAIARDISQSLRAFIIDRNGFTCQMCGAVAGEPHPYDTARKTRLHIGHIQDKSQGGSDDPTNLRAVCSVCNEGASNITLDRPTAMKILTQIRRAKVEEQLEILDWLQKKFPKAKK